MGKCEFFEICSFSKSGSNQELKTSYCDGEPLRCARFMVYQGVGEDKVPEDMLPDEKMKAYEIIAEN